MQSATFAEGLQIEQIILNLQNCGFTICLTYFICGLPTFAFYTMHPKLVFLNVYGAPESIPRNEFRQPM
jgi:hypothetical protein